VEFVLQCLLYLACLEAKPKIKGVLEKNLANEVLTFAV